MILFAELFPDIKIVSTLMTQLSWAHFPSIRPIDDLLKRGFHSEICRSEGWNARSLDKKIQSMVMRLNFFRSEILTRAQVERKRD